MVGVVVVDYGICNVDSVRRALEECGGKVEVSGEPERLRVADRIVLPGVGAFPRAMQNLRARGLDEALRVEVAAGAPLLGICLGMQLLTRASTEAGGDEGLGIIDATVERLSATPSEHRIPHAGWNEVYPTHDHPLFEGVDPGSDFYFVHSYHVVVSEPELEAARTPYMGGFTSAICNANVYGVQFHPEKSHASGLSVLRNFLRVS